MGKIFVALMLVLWTNCSSSVAYSRQHTDVSSPRQIFYLGQCKVDKESQNIYAFNFSACIKAKIGSSLSYFFDNFNENYSTYYGRGYLGLHLSHWLSFHSELKAVVVNPLGLSALRAQDFAPEYTLIRIGNPAVDQFRVSAGRLRLPFGVYGSEIIETLRQQENRVYWQSPPFGVYLTFDDAIATQIDVGISSDIRNKSEHQTRDQNNVVQKYSRYNEAFTVRIARDISIFDSSRIMTSFYCDLLGERRVGGAFITNTITGDSTYFEWVRILFDRTNQSNLFKQIIRFSYVTSWRGSSRWILQVDDEIRSYRMGAVEVNIQIFAGILSRTALSYKRLEGVDRGDKWSVTTGLEAWL